MQLDASKNLITRLMDSGLIGRQDADAMATMTATARRMRRGTAATNYGRTAYGGARQPWPPLWLRSTRAGVALVESFGGHRPPPRWLARGLHVRSRREWRPASRVRRGPPPPGGRWLELASAAVGAGGGAGAALLWRCCSARIAAAVFDGSRGRAIARQRSSKRRLPGTALCTSRARRWVQCIPGELRASLTVPMRRRLMRRAAGGE